MRIVVVAMMLALGAGEAHAQQPDAAGFYRYTTDTGCAFLMDLEPQDNAKGHIWSGNCRPGELISGVGSMITLTDSYVDDRGANIQDALIKTGPWVSGKMHGRFKFENATSTNGGPWTVIPDDCGENWCRTIFFTHDMGVVDYDSAVWGAVDTYAGTAPAGAPVTAGGGRTPVQGTSVNTPRTSVSGAAAGGSFADNHVLTSVSLTDIETLLRDAGFSPTRSTQYPGFIEAFHSNGIRLLASGLVCEDANAVSGCAGLNLRVQISVKTMKTVLRYPDEPVTWQAINDANANLNLSTVYFNQPADTVVVKRVLLVGGGGVTAGTLKAEIMELPVSAKTVIDTYIWPKG
jgi:hypothetical protein